MSSIVEITRRFEVDAGHRVHGHEGKCANLHGHRYAIEVTVSGPRLDAIGRVVDFGVVKEQVGSWLDANWDHAMILYVEDPLLDVFRPSPGDMPLLQGSYLAIASRQKIHVMPANPTAENMAQYLLDNVVQRCIPAHLTCTRVVVRETPNCWAEARLDHSVELVVEETR